MNKKRTLQAVVTVLAIHCFAASSLFAQGGPAQIFAQCQDEMNALSFQCIQANNQTTEGCIAVVELLLEQGNNGAAAFVAHNSILVIRHRTDHCLRDIRRLCRECVQQLHEMGANQLAVLLRQNCEDTVSLVRFSTQSSIRSIQDLFGDKGGG